MWSHETWRSNHKVKFSDSSQPQLVYFWEKTIEHGRGTYESRTDYLISYSSAGELAWLYTLHEGSSELGPERRESVLSFTRQGGQITVIEEKEVLDIGMDDWEEHKVWLNRYTGS